MSQLSKYCIVYNLLVQEGLDIVLPTAIICEIDKSGKIGYMRALALVENLESYGIEISGSQLEEIWALCNELKLSSLEAEFNKGKKKPISLAAIFTDIKVKNVVQSLIDKRLSRFMELVKVNQCPIGFDITRKVKAHEVLLNFHSELAIPNLHFTKTQTGIRYKLELLIKDKKIIPSQHKITLVTNASGIIILDHEIIWMSHVNSSKLKPFMKSDSIFIPEKMVKSYFEQFILDVMDKVEIEVEGFNLVFFKVVKNAKIRPYYDIFDHKWVMELIFDYTKHAFSYHHASKRKSKLVFDESGEITVNQCDRNFDHEAIFIHKLQQLGFKTNASKRLYYNENEYGTIEKLGNSKLELETDFDIEFPEMNGKEIWLSSCKLHPNFRVADDWFDLKGSLQIGDEMYPISRFFKNIRAKDPIFVLDDGRIFILPSSLMSEFEELVFFAKNDGDLWTLNRQHFILVDEKYLSNPLDMLVTNDEDVVYHTPSTLRAELRPYQEQGVKWLIKHRKNNMGACLADDMGLGKTLQTLAALLDAKENDVMANQVTGAIQLDLFGETQQTYTRKSLAALIVLPASLIFNWYEEIKKYVPSFQVVNYTGNQRKSLVKSLHLFDIILTTYQTAALDVDTLKDIQFGYIVLDESQHIKNKNSKVFNALHSLKTKNRISLSGTPIENSLSDLWSQMEFINPAVLGTYSFFKDNFQIPIEKNKDENTIIQLKKMVNPFILRRTKQQVAPDLPELIEQVHYCEMSDDQATIFESEKSKVRNFLLGLNKETGQYKIHVLASLMKLRQIANHPQLVDPDYIGDSGKFEEVVNQMETIIKSGHKLIIFSSFKSYLKLVARWLDDAKYPYVTLTGETPQKERAASVHTFQNDPTVQVFLISIKAGGTGLNLTEADYVFILDPWWNPFVESQAIARAHRIGRKNNVLVTRFISKNTIEEKIMQLQKKKKDVSDDILDMENVPDLLDEEINELLQ